MIDVAKRMSDIKPFHVMDMMARARQLEGQGKRIVHMEVGEPDFAVLPEIVDAARQALAAGQVRYTTAAGMVELREALSDYYRRRYQVTVPARRIVLTPGASGALQLALGVTVDAGDSVLMADPGYPCNRHIAHMYGAEVVAAPVDAASNFQLNLELVKRHWRPCTRAVVLASPSNPVGTLIDGDELKRICEFVRAKNGVAIVDEIYHGLVYGAPPPTAVDVDEHVVVINSFSKYFGMTGWRLGWLVAPHELIEPVERLAQNIFLAPSTIAQYAALAALSDSLTQKLDARRDEFRRRRDYLLPAVQALGFDVPCQPQGAFYLYAYSGNLAADSMDFSRQLLEQAGVAVTPGADFGCYHSDKYVRFAYTTTVEQLKIGVAAMQRYLDHRPAR